MNILRVLHTQTPLLSYGPQENTRVEAPTGQVYLVLTDAKGTEEIWDKAPMTMLHAMSMSQFLVLKFNAHSY